MYLILDDVDMLEFKNSHLEPKIKKFWLDLVDASQKPYHRAIVVSSSSVYTSVLKRNSYVEKGSEFINLEMKTD